MNDIWRTSSTNWLPHSGPWYMTSCAMAPRSTYCLCLEGNRVDWRVQQMAVTTEIGNRMVPPHREYMYDDNACRLRLLITQLNPRWRDGLFGSFSTGNATVHSQTAGAAEMLWAILTTLQRADEISDWTNVVCILSLYSQILPMSVRLNQAQHSYMWSVAISLDRFRF